MFAGIVILTRDRFRVGDQISVGEHRGTVVQMGLTSTSVRTFDGRLVLVPNGTLHSEVVTVQTGFERVRSSVLVDVADSADLDRAARVAVEAMRAVPQVLDEPGPEAFLTSIGTATVQLELRFWSGARQLETKEATHAVVREVLAAFAEHEVEAGSDVYTVDAGPRLARLLRGDQDRATGAAEGSLRQTEDP
ncbi:mechanosensitive ion channel family protein [Ornithinimicrobium kibberense]